MNHIPALRMPHGGWCEELQISYLPGNFQPKTTAEFHAMKGFAIDPPEWNGSDNAEKDALIEEALSVGILDKDGKKVSRSLVERMGVQTLKDAIVAQKATEEAP